MLTDDAAVVEHVCPATSRQGTEMPESPGHPDRLAEWDVEDQAGGSGQDDEVVAVNDFGGDVLG